MGDNFFIALRNSGKTLTEWKKIADKLIKDSNWADIRWIKENAIY